MKNGIKGEKGETEALKSGLISQFPYFYAPYIETLSCFKGYFVVI